MFLRIIFMVICVGILSGFAPVTKHDCCPFELTLLPYKARSTHVVTIATGNAFGSYWSHANGLRKHLNTGAKTDTLSGIEVLETPNPLSNVGEVLQGKAAVAYSSLSMLQSVELGLGATQPTFCLAFPLYETPLSWVIENTEVKTISNLPSGFAIGLGPQFSSTDWFFRQIFALLDKDVSPTNGNWIGLHEQFERHELNGLAYAAGAPNPQIKRLFRKSKPKVFGFSPEEMTLIQDKLHLRPYLILENTYQNQIEPIISAAFWNYAITQCQVNEDWVYELTRLAIEQSPTLPRPRLPVLSEESVKEWTQTGGVPFHPGAIRYFKEQGVDLPRKN